MKLFLSGTVFFFLTSSCFAQTRFIDSIPQKGIYLDSGWKFHSGDNLAWANPDFVDSSWQSINPALDIGSLPQIKPNQIYWLRLHIVFDSNLLKKTLGLIIQQSGASEIYINGKLFYKLGQLGSNQKVIAYDPPANPFPYYINNTYQVLAIRYALQPNVMYSRLLGFNNYGFHAEIKDLSLAINEYGEQIVRFLGQDNFRMGLWFLLTVIHFAFFIFYPSQKANLFFCLYALLNTLAHWGYYLSFNNHLVANKFYYGNVTEAMWVSSSLFIVTALYALLQQKKGYIYWIVVATGIIKIPLNIFSFTYPEAWNIGSVIYSYVVSIEITRISLLAVKTKKKGAWIIAGGAICFIVFWFAYNYSGFFGMHNQFISDVFFNVATLGYPLVISIYLGLEFAFISRSLNKKLKEVEDLSQQTIAQQNEKQQILASQNELLEKQVIERTKKLTASLNELKSMQSQLIQSEKMASLGELTAGIAHEIQNPLNFVNNFSDVNKELMIEMKDEMDKGNIDNARVIADGILDNEEKIIHHGKRAEAIVKGMLQHSKTSTGVKEPTDINKLADEYLRLAYHGMRAKDKEFNAEIKREFDDSIGKTNIIPQDIGRVLLNLFNNAFYAVNEKRQKLNGTFEPVVSVSTKKKNGNIVINVADNGNGIPKDIVDKIFHPFFTTKPAGQGTGLGLSLAYDIVKAHGGEIKVETKKGEGSEFIIQLSIQH